MKVYIIGVGLIGGSIAKDLINLEDYEIIGIDKNKLNIKYFQMHLMHS